MAYDHLIRVGRKSMTNFYVITMRWSLVNTFLVVYVRHNKGVLWYTQGYIPDTSPRGCGGLVESRTGFNKIYQSPKLSCS
jgi:hypothetical protein